MARIHSEAEAIAILDNSALSVGEREDAVHYLQHHRSAAGTERLVKALEDDSFGVRWAAAVALAEAGQDALIPLLRRLVQMTGSQWLREGAYHVLHYNASPQVRREAGELMDALKGSASEIATGRAASALLYRLTSSRQPSSQKV